MLAWFDVEERLLIMALRALDLRARLLPESNVLGAGSVCLAADTLGYLFNLPAISEEGLDLCFDRFA